MSKKLSLFILIVSLLMSLNVFAGSYTVENKLNKSELWTGQTEESFQQYIQKYNSPFIYQDNRQSFDARLKLLDQLPKGSYAKVLSFVFHNSPTTRELAAHLCAAAQRGVNVDFMVESKNGDRPGIPDLFDGDDDKKINEEVYQFLANCGVNVGVHNHIPDITTVKLMSFFKTVSPSFLLGSKKPHDSYSKLFEGTYNLHMIIKDHFKDEFAQAFEPVFAELAVIKDRKIKEIKEHYSRENISKMVSKNAREHHKKFLKLLEEGKEINNRTLPQRLPRNLEATYLFHEGRRKILALTNTYENFKSKLIKLAIEGLLLKVKGNTEKSSLLEIGLVDLLLASGLHEVKSETLKNAINDLMKRFRENEELYSAYWVAHRANRLNHRKLFYVESPNQEDACIVLGGRNLGDHYLANHHDSHLDSDILYCNHHGKQVENVISEAKESFEQYTWSGYQIDVTHQFYQLNNYDDYSQPSDEDVYPDYTNFDLQQFWLEHDQGNIISRIFPNPKYNFEFLYLAKGHAPSFSGTVQNTVNIDTEKTDEDEKHPNAEIPNIKVEQNEEPVFGNSLAQAYDWEFLRTDWDSYRAPDYDEVRNRLYEYMENEKAHIFIESAYVELDERGRNILEQALQRGVDVDIITNSIFISDAGSKAIRLLSGQWIKELVTNYGKLAKNKNSQYGDFNIRFTTLAGGHMIHFKGASFACQSDGTQYYRTSIIGSHNYHSRSGYSDKEHALTWKEAPSSDCLSKVADSVSEDQMVSSNTAKNLFELREEYYAKLNDQKLKEHEDVIATLQGKSKLTEVEQNLLKANPKLLENYTSMYFEIEDAILSGKLTGTRLELAESMQIVIFGNEKYDRTENHNPEFKSGENFSKLLEVLRDGGAHDLFGYLL